MIGYKAGRAWAWGTLLGCAFLAGCGGSSGAPVVVCYTSTDQVFAEPILQAFEQQSGIRVRAKYDTEETKTTGLVNLIQAEKGNPQADVFWSSETGRAIALKQAGCLATYRSPNAEGIPAGFKDPEGYWTGFSARARVILYNTELVKVSPPSSVMELISPAWQGKAAIANPLFGTTSFHATTLFLRWGDAQAKDFFRRVRENGVQILPSNGAVKDAVSDGRATWGVLDTDDANVALKEGRPVAVLFPDQEGAGTVIIPNTVSLIAGAPRPETGKQLIDYLLSPQVEQRLAEMDCVQMPLRPGVPTPPGVRTVSSIDAQEVDYTRVAERIREVDGMLKEVLGL
ncbi:MAG: extracellular solute-binding protein [Candidatus Latescibacteria bacterium]|nr:extracellular solute-binding protein [Candidatus Latescibacterota bacterium]